MKHYFIIILFLTFVSYSFGQSPSAAPTTSPEKPRIKNFGSSIKKFGKKNQQASQSEQKNDDSDEETIRVKTDLVISDVLVVNQKGNAILNLTQDDFVVTEDEMPQEIKVFSFGESATIPRSIVLIIDYSGSQLPFIKNSVEAAKKLVDKLAPQDRMAIVTDDVKLLVEFTKDKDLLKKNLDKLKDYSLSRNKFGRSKQYTALVATLNEMFDEEDIRPIIIFQTDGDELPLLKTNEKLSQSYYPLQGRVQLKAYSFEDVCALVSQSRATIYSIIPGFRLIGLSQEEQIVKARYILGGNKNKSLPKEKLVSVSNMLLGEQSALFELTQLSGGYTDFIEKPEDAENVYSTLFNVINNRYVIGYYPANEERNGKRRNVKIEVKNHPEFIVTGRKSYFASESGK